MNLLLETLHFQSARPFTVFQGLWRLAFMARKPLRVATLEFLYLV